MRDGADKRRESGDGWERDGRHSDPTGRGGEAAHLGAGLVNTAGDKLGEAGVPGRVAVTVVAEIVVPAPQHLVGLDRHDVGVAVEHGTAGGAERGAGPALAREEVLVDGDEPRPTPRAD